MDESAECTIDVPRGTVVAIFASNDVGMGAQHLVTTPA